MDWRTIPDKIIFWSFAAIFFLVPLFFLSTTSELFEFNKIILTYALSALILCSWLIKIVLSSKISLRLGFLGWPLLIYLGSHLLSTIFSIDPHISFWGYYSRWHEGLLASTIYIFLYFAVINNLTADDIKKIITWSFVSAVILSIWGAFEHFGHSFSCLLIDGYNKFDVGCWVQDVKNRVYATLGQPNWMAAYLVVQILVFIGYVQQQFSIFNFQFSNKKSIIQFSILALFFAALLFTKSRSGILGLGGGMFVFVSFWLAQNRFWMRPATAGLTRMTILTVGIFLFIAAIFGLPFAQAENLSLEKFLTSAPAVNSEPATVNPGYIDIGISQSSDIRKIVWEGAIKVWQRYPIFGSGVETFALAYYKDRPVAHNMVSEWDFLYNKAHNEFLNLLATTGTVGFLTYLFVIGSFCIWFCRMSFRTSEARSGIYKIDPGSRPGMTSLFCAWVSILVTNFFGFSVVIIGLYFFLIPAFIETLNHETK